MRIYQRTPGGAYWFAFHHRGKPFRRSTGTTDRQAAQEYADRFRAELWRAAKFGERAAVSWDTAALDWIEHNGHLRALSDRKDHLRWATRHLTGKPLAAIDREELTRLGKLKAAEGVGSATVNRYLASISAVLGHAVERKWLDSQPRIPRRPEASKEPRWATQRQADKLVAALPDHLAPMAAFSLATGLRWANVAGLRWERVNLKRRTAWIPAAQAKGKRALTIPLSDAALAVLKAQKGQHRAVVFPYHGRAVATYGKPAWDAACLKAGLRGFTWHDLRHTWASWHVQHDTPLAVLQQLGGWRSLSMVMVYSHLAPSHVAAYAGNAGPVQDRYKGGFGSRKEKAA